MDVGPSTIGTLVVLADGGAPLVGRATAWETTPDGYSGTAVRTLRLDPGTGRWTEIDARALAYDTRNQRVPAVEAIVGHSRQDALAVRLRDGRVLIAGGRDDKLTNAVDLYDPAGDRWSSLPAMPEPRAGGAAVALPDGSVLLVGGHGEIATCGQTGSCDCGEGPTGVSTAVRFVPGP